MTPRTDPLLDALRRHPDDAPPEDFAAGVLSRITPRRVSPAARLARFLSSPLVLSFRPGMAAAVCALLLAVFVLGYRLGRESTGRPVPVELVLAQARSSLAQGRLAEAVSLWDEVLAVQPDNRDALFHRALALGRLGRAGEEDRAWRGYLHTLPVGQRAILAAERLNTRGDFAYSAHQLGARTLVLPRLAFDGQGRVAAQSLPALEQVAGVLSNNPSLLLHVVVYVQGDAHLAEMRGRSIREHLLRLAPLVSPGRIALSWFGVAETVEVSGAGHSLEQSVRFIGLPEPLQGKGV